MNMKHSVIFGLLLAALMLVDASAAFAQQQPIPPGVCTTDPTFNISNNTGLITAIVNNIKNVLYAPGGVAESLFSNITGGSGFWQAVGGALSLYVVIYGISFMIGIVQVTVVDFAMRMVKIGIIIILVRIDAWQWFYNTVGVFFNDGMDWLIGVALSIAAGSGMPVDPNDPFSIIDSAVGLALSPKMFVTFMATLSTGPYGLLIGILMIIGMGTFVAALFQIIWVYLMALVVRAFLLGIAPIFIPMILFSKTQHLFFNWLNQLVNTLLQPVFLFTFFAFFINLVLTALNNMLGVAVCVMPGMGMFRGTPMDQQLWRFTVNGQPYGGAWSWDGPVDFPGTPFPINVVDVLMFLLLVQLAWRFNGIALNVAREISSANISLNMQGAFSSFLDPSKKVNPQLPGASGGRRAGGAAGAAAAGGEDGPQVRQNQTEKHREREDILRKRSKGPDEKKS